MLKPKSKGARNSNSLIFRNFVSTIHNMAVRIIEI